MERAFFHGRVGRPAIEAGEDCFSGLLNRSLLEVVDRTYYGAADTCKINDTVHDLVHTIAKDCEFFHQNSFKFRHLVIQSDMNLENLRANKTTRTLLCIPEAGEVKLVSSEVAKRFCEFPYLRIMNLSRSIFTSPLSQLLNDIGFLQHLAYLNLSNIDLLVELPPSKEKLSNLQFLGVSYCKNLKTLPAYIVILKKLRILDISHCSSLEYLPKGLGRLSQLEVLLGFKPAKLHHLKGCHIGELRTLNGLRKLGLQLTGGTEIISTEEDPLEDLQELQYLSISCRGCTDPSILDMIHPPLNIQELSLHFYRGKVMPSWLNPNSLPSLRYLSICSGNIANIYESFFGNASSVCRIEGLLLRNLDLEVDWSNKVDWSKVQNVMPLLKIVNASWCTGLPCSNGV